VSWVIGSKQITHGSSADCAACVLQRSDCISGQPTTNVVSGSQKEAMVVVVVRRGIT
jgi:hypothetical protein